MWNAISAFFSLRPEAHILGILTSLGLFYFMHPALRKQLMKILKTLMEPFWFISLVFFYFSFTAMFYLLIDFYGENPATIYILVLFMILATLATENWAKERFAKSIATFSKQKIPPETEELLKRFFDAERNGTYEECTSLCHGEDLKENSDYLKGVKHELVELIGMQKSQGAQAVLVKINYSEHSDYMVYWIEEIDGSLKIVGWADFGKQTYEIEKRGWCNGWL